MDISYTKNYDGDFPEGGELESVNINNMQGEAYGGITITIPRKVLEILYTDLKSEFEPED